jgi:hypothetical protein
MDNALTYLNSLRPALPYSIEKPCQVASNGEVKRWMQNNAVIVNGQPVKWDTPIDFEVVSLVFFPKSKNRRTTLV